MHLLNHHQSFPFIVNTHQWEVMWNNTTLTSRRHSTSTTCLPPSTSFIPSMKTFHTKHHAYKFQVAITIVSHKAMDQSVVTQPPVTSEIIAVCVADTAPPLDDVNRQLLNFIEVFELNGSVWVFSNF